MDVHDLMAALSRDEDRVPRERIDECAQHGAAMIEALGAVIGPEADWSACESDGHWQRRLHAAFILGLMDDAAAGRLLLHLMRRFAGGEDDNLDEWLSGFWPALFRNKLESIFPDVEAFAWSHHAQPYMRGHAVEVLLAAAALQKGRFAVFGQQDVEAAYTGPDKPGWLRFDDPWKFHAPEQIAARQGRWADEEQRRQHRESIATDWDDEHLARETYVRDTPKVGRNDPCPCGSGRQHEKCCLGGVFSGAADS